MITKNKITHTMSCLAERVKLPPCLLLRAFSTVVPGPGQQGAWRLPVKAKHQWPQTTAELNAKNGLYAGL